MVRPLKLMNLLCLHKFKLLFLNNNVPEAVLHLESIECHLVLLLGLVLDRGPRTVVPLELQGETVTDRVTPLG